MTQFLHILTHVIFPILLMTGAGYLLQKRQHLDFTAFSKMLFFLVLPSLVFTRLYDSTLSVEQVGVVAAATVVLMSMMAGISWIFSRLRRHKRSMAVAFLLSTVMYNSGNYGLSVAELVFGASAFATSVQVLVFTLQGIFTFTLGVTLIARGKMSLRQALLTALRYPMIYGILLAFLFRRLDLPVWQPVWASMEMLSRALIPMALVLLGAQLADTPLTSGLAEVFASSAIRLLLGPVVMSLALRLLHVEGLLAQVLLIASSMPTAVNSALLAVEFQSEPEFASQAVFLSTALSVLTVSATVYAAIAWLG